MLLQKISYRFELTKKSKYRLILVGICLIIFYLIPKEYIGDKYPICLYRIILGKKCFGCGTTRAVWSIIHGRFKDAIMYNKLIIITFPLITGCVLNFIFRRK
jgi:fucose 4-O-acetylase-like acetyltransferase